MKHKPFDNLYPQATVASIRHTCMYWISALIHSVFLRCNCPEYLILNVYIWKRYSILSIFTVNIINSLSSIFCLCQQQVQFFLLVPQFLLHLASSHGRGGCFIWGSCQEVRCLKWQTLSTLTNVIAWNIPGELALHKESTGLPGCWLQVVWNLIKMPRVLPYFTATILGPSVTCVEFVAP